MGAQGRGSGFEVLCKDVEEEERGGKVRRELLVHGAWEKLVSYWKGGAGNAMDGVKVRVVCDTERRTSGRGGMDG